MIILRKKGSRLLIFVDDNIMGYNCSDGSQKTLKIPQAPIPCNTSKSYEEVVKPENRKIMSVSALNNAELVAVTLQNKQLVIYDKKFNVVNNILTKRAVSKVRFIDQNNLLVADKTGDVFLYKLKPEVESELLLGHLSMLLDIAVSECGKYIITCDRDEKIRVSCFPNAYNIVNYCLGHREFVTNVEVSGDILISASGDGTLRFWNFLEGKQLAVVNTNEHIKDKSAILKFCKEMDNEKVDVSAVPIIDMQIFRNGVTYVGISLVGFSGIQLYCMEILSGNLNIRFLDNVVTPEEVISFSLNQELFILTSSELLMYDLKTTGSCIKADSEEICRFYENCKSLLAKNNNIASIVTGLYKRKFDNVQEYLEKKKLRVESKS